jgi:glycine cleavage system H protein
MSETRYTDQHEWVRVEGDEATVGITKYAAEQLGDVVFVEVPEPGRSLAQGGDAAVVESVKAASEVYAPIGGEVTAGNPYQ